MKAEAYESPIVRDGTVVEQCALSETDKAGAYPVDSLLPGNEEFWDLLENDCMPECCGIQSFNFSTESLKNAIPDTEELTIKRKLESSLESVRELDCEIVISKRLNWVCSKESLLLLLTHLRNAN